MSRHHHKSHFLFFSIICIVFLAGLGYFFFHNYAPNDNIFWVDASIRIKTNTGGCLPTFPCYETFFLDQDANVYYNNASRGRLSESKTKSLIKESYNAYKNNVCTPAFDAKVSQDYELKIDENLYEFGGSQGCKEMQDVVTALTESIN